MAYNLLKQVKTFHGKLNCYVVDSLDDLESLSSRDEEIIGCRAFSISNGKFYIMNSQKEWHEAIPVFNTSLQDTVTRKGVYTWTFDPTIHDGIQEIEVEFIPTLQEIEETITRGGDYTFNYDRVDYDGFDDITIHVKPTLQEIEEDIEEGGDYEYTFDPENYDGLSKVTRAKIKRQDKEEHGLQSFKDEDVRKFMQYIEKQAKAYEFNLPNRSYDIYAFAKDLLVWLEKQSEQESSQINERVWLYLISDVLTWKDGIGQYLDDPRVQELAKRLCKEYAQKLYNPSNTGKNEQKSADKIEPKFNVGDWVTIKQ